MHTRFRLFYFVYPLITKFVIALPVCLCASPLTKSCSGWDVISGRYAPIVSQCTCKLEVYYTVLIGCQYKDNLKNHQEFC